MLRRTAAWAIVIAGVAFVVERGAAPSDAPPERRP